MRFDHYITKRLQISERDARTRIASGEFEVDGTFCTDLRHPITRFDEVRSGHTTLQPALNRLYLMLHKPAGVVSATIDAAHTTAIDLIEHSDKETLHLAGRLDRASTGLVLLTNDSNWSESLTQPDNKVEKVYFVETDRPIPKEAVSQFAKGFHFASEAITTRPAHLEILAPCQARVTLQEGRWHQIKRMFHRLDGIRLTSLHRTRIGNLSLPDALSAGEWRPLTEEEAQGINT